VNPQGILAFCDGCGSCGVLILTFDGKGIVMLPEALRPATAKAAAEAQEEESTGSGA
jgi:hypothetical protein